MTVLTLFANGIMAYGPSFAIVGGSLGQDATLFMLFLASGFCWLLSILLTSVIWYGGNMNRSIYGTIIWGVFMQELFRILFYYGVR